LFAKVGREDLLKPKILNAIFHESSISNGVRVVSFVMSRSMTVNRTNFPHRNIHKYISISPDGKTHEEIDHILMAWRRYSSILDVPSFRAADNVWYGPRFDGGKS
jgi:hypothetical protein